jgi:hypothetical protein
MPWTDPSANRKLPTAVCGEKKSYGSLHGSLSGFRPTRATGMTGEVWTDEA